ncbi:MAG: hypothetical protein ACREUY_00870, partial [Burkholderiales bacterium]
MGRYHRSRPARLAEKLLQIRVSLGLSQNAMIRCLGLEDEISQSRISGYELRAFFTGKSLSDISPFLIEKFKIERLATDT